MLRGFIELYNLDGNPAYVNNARRSLEYAWEKARSEEGLFQNDLSGQVKERSYNLITQAAMAEMYARLGAMMD